LRLAHKQGVEARARRRRARDGDFAAPFDSSEEQSRLGVAQRFGDERERRDGLGRQEINHCCARILARPEGEQWGAPRGHSAAFG